MKVLVIGATGKVPSEFLFQTRAGGSCQAWVARRNRDAVGFQSKGTAGTEETTGHAKGRSISAFWGSLIYG